MKTVLFEVASLEQMELRIKAQLKSGKPDRYARITFDSAEQMSRIMTPTRWGLVEAMTGAGPIGVRELGRQVGRDVKGVHTDANALVIAGVIDRTDDGKYVFPFEKVKVQFEFPAIAA